MWAPHARTTVEDVALKLISSEDDEPFAVSEPSLTYVRAPTKVAL
jgi:hypothetical protein